MSEDQEKIVVRLFNDKTLIELIKQAEKHADTYGDLKDYALDFMIGALTSRYNDVARSIANMEAIKISIVMQNMMPMSSKIYDAVRGPSRVKVE